MVTSVYHSDHTKCSIPILKARVLLWRCLRPSRAWYMMLDSRRNANRGSFTPSRLLCNYRLSSSSAQGNEFINSPREISGMFEPVTCEQPTCMYESEMLLVWVSMHDSAKSGCPRTWWCIACFYFLLSHFVAHINVLFHTAQRYPIIYIHI